MPSRSAATPGNDSCVFLHRAVGDRVLGYNTAGGRIMLSAGAHAQVAPVVFDARIPVQLPIASLEMWDVPPVDRPGSLKFIPVLSRGGRWAARRRGVVHGLCHDNPSTAEKARRCENALVPATARLVEDCRRSPPPKSPRSKRGSGRDAVVQSRYEDSTVAKLPWAFRPSKGTNSDLIGLISLQ